MILHSWLTTVSNRIRNVSARRRLGRKFRGNRFTQQASPNVRQAPAAFGRLSSSIRKAVWQTFDASPRWTSSSRRFQRQVWQTYDVAPSTEKLEDRTLLSGLSIEAIEVMAQAGIERWEQSGLSDVQRQALESISYNVADLPGNQIGMADGLSITLDSDLPADANWFIDATPLDDEEFSTSGSAILSPNSSLLYTSTSGNAIGRFDLLSAVMHEQGHVLGLTDVEGAGSDVMHGAIDRGVRRLAYDGQAADAIPGVVKEAEFLVATNLGFETGDFSGWTSIGNAGIDTSNPSSGTYHAIINSGAGISTGSNTSSGTPYDAVNGSGITTTVTGTAGEVVSFQYNFMTREFANSGSDFTFNDTAFAVVTKAGIGAILSRVLASVATDLPGTVNGELRQTGYRAFNYTLPVDGTYTIGFGVVNGGDPNYATSLQIDDVLAAGYTPGPFPPAVLPPTTGSDSPASPGDSILDSYFGLNSGDIDKIISSQDPTAGIDLIPPVLNLPTNIVVTAASGATSAIVTYPAITATDDVDGSVTPTQTQGLGSGSAFSIGVTTNVFQATDATGNSAAGSFTVTVLVPVDTEVTLPGGVLTITDINGGNSNDNLTISFAGGNYTITDTGGALIDASSIAGSTGSGTATVTVPVGTINGIDISTLGGNDTITINSLQASLAGGFTLNGGTGSDTATINSAITTSGTGSVSVTTTNLIDINASIITTTAANQPITLDAPTVQLGAGLFTDGGTVTIRDSVGALADVALDSGANVTIDTEDGNDSAAGTLDLSDATIKAAGGVANLTIRTATGGASDSADITLPTFGGPAVNNLTVDASNSGPGTAGDVTINGKINLNGNADIDGRTVTFSTASSDLSVDGTSTVNIDATRNIVLSSGSSITTVNGGITLNANSAGTTTGNFIGLDADNAAIQTSGTGNISLTGKGANNGNANSEQYGIHIHGGSSVSSSSMASGAGTITIAGTGGAGTTSNFGVLVADTTTDITSVEGAVSITGQGGNGSGTANYGVRLQNIETLSSTGTTSTAATITVNGTGGSGSDNDHGVYFSGGTTDVSSVNGNVSITGTGGSGGSSNFGVLLESIESISSSGTGSDAADITIIGTGDNGTSSNTGVHLSDGSSTDVTSSAGDITITGTGGGGSTNNFGVNLEAGALVQTATGVVQLTGTGGGSSGVGIRMVAGTGGSVISTGAGTIALTATAASTSQPDLDAGSSSVIGGSSATGSISINADSIALSSSLSVESDGALTIQPRTTTTSIGLGGGSGTLNLDDTELAFLQNGFSGITIGDATSGTGTVTVNTATFLDPVTISGGDIQDNVSGADITAPSVTFDGNVTPGPNPGVLFIEGDITFAANSTFTVEIGGETPGTTADNHDQLRANSGSVVIPTSATLTTLDFSSFGATLVGGETFTIIDVVGAAETLTGNFNGLGEGATVSTNFLSSGLTATISYVGGTDSNDAVITVETVIPPVNLSVDATTGTEAGTTIITATATADAAVMGNQTLTITPSGTGITAGDYTLSNTTITILNGATQGQVTFTIVDDQRLEGDEVATLTISNPSSGISIGTTSTQNVTITDDETGVINFDGDASNAESVDPTPDATLTITASGTGTIGLDKALTVTASNAGTGSTVAADLSTVFGTQILTFAAGDGTAINSNTATLDVNDDQRLEGDETVNLTFAGTLSSTLDGQVSEGDATHTATITDNETGVINFAADASNAESVDPTQNATLTITGSGSGTEGLDVTLTVAATDAGGGTATSAVDYAAYGSQTLTFTAGNGTSINSDNGTLDVTVDGDVETDETVNLQIGSLSDTLDGQVTINDSTHVASITNDDFDTEVTLVGGVLTTTDINGAASNDALAISFAGGNYTITDTGGLILNTAIAGATGQSTSTLVIPDTGVTGINFNVLGGDDSATVLGGSPGNVDLTVTGGDGTDSVTFDTSATVLGSGSVTVTAESAAINSAVTANGGITLTVASLVVTAALTGSGTLRIQPAAAATTIGIGGGTGDLNLDDTELALLSNGFSSITIGKADAGDIDIDTATFNDPLTLITGGDIHDNAGTDLNMAGGDTVSANGTVAPGQSPGILNITGNLAFADNSTYEVEVGGNTAGIGGGFHDQIDATGSVTIGTGVALNTASFGGFVPSPGDTYEIINRTGGTGTFAGLAEGAEVAANFLGSGLPATISYVGGDGDDVVITLDGSGVTLIGGDLTVSGDGAVNTYVVTLINGGNNIQIEDTTNPIFAGTGATQVNANTITVPAAGLTGTFTVNSGAAADSLEIDFTGTDPTVTRGLTWNGGDPTSNPGDTMSFSNGSFTTTTYTYDNLNDGNVDIDGIVFNYFDLEPITSTITATNVILNYSAAAETITVSDAGGGSTTVNSTLGEITTFVHPTTLLQINAGDTGVNNIRLEGLAANYPADIDINGGNGGDTVELRGSTTFAADKSLTIDADIIANFDFVGNTPFTSTMTTSGTGSIALNATQKVFLTSDATLNTVNGGITLNGNAAGGSAAVPLTGVDLVGATVATTGTGAINITGQGGTSGDSKGIFLRSGAQVTSSLTAGGGAITLNGTSNSTDALDFGVSVEDSSLIDSKSGAIMITGNGGSGGGASNHGVRVSGGADITSSDVIGAATITINGTGGSGGASAGLVLNDTGTTITSITGDINITANGGSTNGAGVATSAGAKIASLGAANLTITADGTASDAFSADGFTIGDAAGSGTITLTGDEFTLTGTSAIDGSGALIIQPQTVGTTIEVGDVNSTLSLNDTELGFLSDGFTSITIGKADAGDVNLDTATFSDPVTIITAGTIRDEAGTDLTLGGTDTATLNGTVTPGQAAPGVFTVTGAVTFADSTEYQVQIGGTSPGTGNGFHDQIDATGAVTIGNNVTLTTSAFFDGGGTINFVPAASESFEIINRTGGTGTFSGLAEGAIVSTDFLSSGLRAQITYMGGDGDDVVLNILPADVNVVAGDLTVIDEVGVINTYIITLIDGGATIQIEDTTSPITAGTGATQVNANTVTVPTASVTNSIRFDGLAGADSLEVSRAGGDPTVGLGLTWNGGNPTAAPGDVLSFTNGSVTTTTFNHTNATSGTVDIDGIVHTYNELESAASVITSSLTSANVVLNHSVTGETITVTDPGGSSTTVTSTATAEAPTTTFSNPTTLLTINAGDTGNDIVNITSLATSYPAGVTINGEGGTDTVNINGAVSLTASRSITVNAEAITDNAGMTVSGTGTLDLTADEIDLLGGAGTVSGAAGINLTPASAAAHISVGFDSGGADFDLDDTDLAALVGGFSLITIGDTGAGTGAVDINTATFASPVQIAGGTISDNAGADIAAGTNAVTLQGTVAPGQTIGVLTVTGNVAFADNDTFSVDIGGTSPGELATNHDQVDVTGTVTIGANVTLATATSGGFAPIAGDEFVIINNDAADAVTGTFQGLAEGSKIPNFLGSGRNGTLSYVGGDGNDVVITSDGFTVFINAMGNLVISDNAPTDDDVTIQADSGTMEYVISHTSQIIGNLVPPHAGTGTMTVRVPFASVTGSEIIANLGGGNDSLTVDYATTNDSFDKTISFNGGETGEAAGDKLFIIGDAGTTVASGIYTPGTTAEAGQHVLTLSGGGTETINFTQLELSNQVSAIPSYSLTTGGSNDVLSVDAEALAGPIAAATVTGTTDLAPITPLTLFDVASVNIDTGTNDAFGGGAGNDSVTVNSGLDDGVDLARNLMNFSVDTGSAGTGNVDSVTINAVIDAPASVTIDDAETVDVDVDIEAGTSITISNVDTEIDLAQDVDLTAQNGDLSLNTNVTLLDLSGGAGTNNLVANDTDASGDGNISVGPISDSGTPASLVINGDNAVTLSSVDVQSTITVLANQDATGGEGFSHTGTIATSNDTAAAVSITVNTGGGGTGGATLGAISAGTTSGPTGGRITVAANAGAITDGNGAANNLTAGNAVLSATAGVGSLAAPIETTLSRLEAFGGTGGVFITDANSLTIGGIDAGVIGVSSANGDIDVRTTSGTLTVEENVTATGSGNILLKTTDAAGVGDDLTVNAGVTISSNSGSIDLEAGDNVTLAATSHLNAPGDTISITGDSGDADAGIGSTLTIAAELDSTGTALNGGSDDDSYNFFYPTGVTNSGTVTIADTGGTDDVMIHGTAAAEELFLTTADPPTTATTEQVTRATNTAEPVIIPSDIEAVTLLGGDGNDIFHVQPSMLFPVTVNGNNPSFGDAGVPPGDQLDLDTFGNSFTIAGKTIFVANGTPNPFLGITFLNIETVPLTPSSAGPDQSFDFNDTFYSGGTRMRTPTQAGFTGVTSDTLFTTGNFGWQTATSAFTTGTNTGVAGDLINDGHSFTPSSGGVTNTFTATVGNGFVMATVTFGSDFGAIDGMQIENADDNSVIVSGLSTAIRETDHVTFLVNVQDGTLDLRFRDPHRNPRAGRLVSIKGIDIETDGGSGTLGFLSMGFPTPGTLTADGTTVDTFTLSAAEPNSLVTVETTLGTLTGTDADANVEGFQVLTDGAGEAPIMIQRPTAAGQALVSLSSPMGRKTGCIVIDYGQVAGRNFDFNTNLSATFSPFDATTNPDGYIGVVPDDLFTAERGYGWTTTAPNVFQVTPSVGGAMPELVDDGHIASDPRTFRTTLANGTYQVHVTMGGRGDHQSKSISANGTLVVDSQSIDHRTFFETIFTVTVTSGQLDLTFSQNDNVFGSNHWLINALEIRPTASVTPITPAANVGDMDANGSLIASTSVSFNTTAPDGTLMTVSSTLGTSTTPDADPNTVGTQVAVAGGTVTFTLLPGNKSGTPTIEVHSLDGEHRATVTDAAFLNYVVPVTRRLDFNTRATNHSGQSATAAGFIGVLHDNQSPATFGFGSNENRLLGFSQDGNIPGVTNDDFYRDGLRLELDGENGSRFSTASETATATFLVEAKAATDYDVRVYLGAPLGLAGSSNFDVTVEGAGTQTVGTLAEGVFTSLVFSMADDADGDGFITLTFDDNAAPFNGFGIPGIDIAETATGLPAVAPLLAAEHAAGHAITATNPVTISESDLATAIEVATIAFLDTDLSASQRGTLQALSISIADLDAGLLGLADGAVITIDDDGAGAGWSSSLSDVASDRYDLLTVVGHEIGHALGRADSDRVSDFQDLMNSQLSAGIRHDSLGEIEDFFGAAIADVSGVSGGPVDPVSSDAAITVSIDASGNLLITDGSADGLNQSLNLSTNDGVLSIVDLGNPLIADAGSLMSGHEIHVPISLITNQTIVVDLRGGDDILTASAVGASLSLNVSGGAGNDMITGGQHADTIDGGAGNDGLSGGGGTDTLQVTGGTSLVITASQTFGAGVDVHDGFEQAVLSGGAGNDRLDASQADIPVTLLGLGGDDTLLGSSTDDLLDGGEGLDVAEFVGSDITLNPNSVPGAGIDILVSVEGMQLVAAAGAGSRIDASAWQLGGVTIVGSSGNDTLTGSAGDDYIIAGSGHDVVSGGAGNDVIAGGAGRDILSGEGGDDTISGGQGQDTIDGGMDNDYLRGGQHADTIRGGGGDDRLFGDSGSDVLEGADGSDSLLGGTGTDSLVGGAGNDTLNNIAVADDFNATVDDDLLIGGDAPQARPAPIAATPDSAPSFSLPPTTPSSSNPTESNSGEEEPLPGLDDAFGSPLLLNLLGL